jgi:AbrB family looped-hinge helix DNA binding protein
MYGRQSIMSTKHRINQTVKASTDGKTTIPVQVRDYLDIEKGDEVRFKDTEDGEIVFEKVQ